MSVQLLTGTKMSIALPIRNCKKFKRRIKLEAKGTDPDLVEELRSWLDDEEETHVKISIVAVKNPDDGSPTLDYVVSSRVLEQLQRLMCVHEDVEQLKLKLDLIIWTDGDDTRGFLSLTDFIPHPDKKDGNLSSKYICRDNQLLISNEDQYFLEMQLSVETSGYIQLSDLVSTCDLTTQAIFTERKYCDFELVSKDGSGVACHKDFLRVHSSVLKATIDGEFVEGQRGKLVMQDATITSVQAFLEFVYYKSVKKACKFSNVAFELLKAADYYDMELLWKVMVRILIGKPLEWFQVEVGLELFEFAVKKVSRDGIADLKEKGLKVLARNIKALDESPLFLEMFSTTPAREMFKSMLEREAFRETVKSS